MSPRRSKPLLIAPLIPAWAVIGFFVSEWLHGSRLYLPFLVLWAILAIAFAGYILRQAMQARRAQNSVRGSLQ